MIKRLRARRTTVFQENLLAANRRLLAKQLPTRDDLQTAKCTICTAIVLHLRPWMQTSCKLSNLISIKTACKTATT